MFLRKLIILQLHKILILYFCLENALCTLHIKILDSLLKTIIFCTYLILYKKFEMLICKSNLRLARSNSK